MSKTKNQRGPAAKADQLVRKAFTNVAVQPTPDHLIDLVDELEAAARAGRLNRSSRAA